MTVWDFLNQNGFGLFLTVVVIGYFTAVCFRGWDS